MGHTLLNRWNLDGQIIQAALQHHNDAIGDRRNDLAALVSLADYLCGKCNLGFYTGAPVPSPELLARCGLGEEPAVTEIVEQIAQAYRDESSLFKIV